ncbi:AMP-binding enzyme family protein [Tritrichomonas foetus]|uniref:acetate--CoA ligase n=1 Tax=Tritrichomonas foetus TaxID=1144522 RepID=A0A1J4K6V3_9EUKA|nr:AMP-binding enzyme family protein [Tritrichomonas foetus]|eukprot:OHT06915.1 AMP-binding enzyme family protein [Tritrichomonas foetus]
MIEADLFDAPIPIDGYKSYQDMCDHATDKDPKKREEFWADVARKLLHWESSEFTNVIGEIGNNKSIWFDGGKFNICYNAVDRHVKEDPNRVALIYEGNGLDDGYQVTYGELLTKVCKMANILKSLGVTKGSVVSIYLPVCLEAIYAMLACTRIGAIHSLVFGAFRGSALEFRINDCKPTVVVTANSYARATKKIPMKISLDAVLPNCPSVKHVVVCRLTDDSPNLVEGRDILFDEAAKNVSDECPCTPVNSADPVFYLYTSGSTGNPKGIIHRSGGYAVAASLTHRFVFSLRPGDIFGCTSDLGWITGHSYVCYGPLLNGVTTLIFGGLPLYPDARRPWQLISKLHLTHFYTSPSAARAIAASKVLDQVEEYDISSLRILGSVGEALDDTTWHFLFETLGKKKCAIVDTYWQTEMGSIIATSIPGHNVMRPGFVGKPLFGTELVLLDTKDHHVLTTSVPEIKPTEDALLCIGSPWPGLANDSLAGHDVFVNAYLVPGTKYFSTGDLAAITEDGFIKITGRTDDQLCVNGHRVGPAEVEAVIIEHPKVREAAVVGVPHPLSGQTIVAFVTSNDKSPELVNQVKEIVSSKFSAIGRPSAVYIVDDLPKTRSEKIIRMLLRALLIDPENVKEPPTLKNPECVSQIRAMLKK